MNPLKEREDKLIETIKSYKSAVVAFSGGTDSTYLCALAYEALKDDAWAYTVFGPSSTDAELEEARLNAARIGIKHVILSAPEFEDEDFLTNTDRRCYFCKRARYRDLLEEAKRIDANVVLDGSNLSDKDERRPGAKAVEELGIKTPLADASLSKGEIRSLSRERGLSTADKPSSACLISRIPYNEELSVEKLKLVERAEKLLGDAGFSEIRFRLHNSNIGRIEAPEAEIERLFNMREKVNSVLKAALGIPYISLDLGGYRSGSMDEAEGL